MSESATIVAGNPVIREATEADLTACATVINDYIDETEWLPRVHSREAIAAMFSPELLERRTLLVAEIDGEVAGYLSLGADNAPDGFVHAIYLARRARNTGVGRLMFERARRHCPRQLELTVFETNVNAKRFYEREGFVEIPEGRKNDTDEGIPTLLMRWRVGE